MEEKIIIRRAVPEDIEDIHEIDMQAFSLPWSYEAREHDLVNVPMAIYHVAEIKGENGEKELAGYTGVWHIMEQVDINDVAVSPKHRRKHIASALMEAMINETRENGAEAWTLEVRAGNTAAIKLYECFDFRGVAVRKGYYPDNGEDAILMWKR